MGQSFQLLENIAPLVKASSTTITMAPTYLGMPTRITVGGQQFKTNGTITLNTGASPGINALDTGSLTANTLYYIYAVQSSGVLGIVASTNAPGTGPAGFGAWKEIGRFRTFLGSAAISIVVNKLISNNAQPPKPEWETFTPTWQGTVPMQSHTFKQRRNGSDIEIFGYVQLSGAVVGNFYLIPPDGRSISIAADSGIISSSNVSVYGVVRVLDSGTNYRTTGQVAYGSPTLILFMENLSTTQFNATTPITWGNNDALTITMSAPMAEYVGLD